MIDFKKLGEPFPAKDIEWRLQECGKKKSGEIWAMCLAYITNRAIMQRLDDVCGPENWKNEYAPGPHGGIICGLSIRCGEEWVTKWDGADNTAVEAVKGGLSDAMKRAGVQWNIGRYLYNLESGWAEIADKGEYRGKIKDGGEYFKWNPPKLPAWALPAGAKPETKPAPKPPEKAAPDMEARNTDQWIKVMEKCAKDESIATFRGWWKQFAADVTTDCGDEGAAKVYAAWAAKGAELAKKATEVKP